MFRTLETRKLPIFYRPILVSNSYFPLKWCISIWPETKYVGQFGREISLNVLNERVGFVRCS